MNFEEEHAGYLLRCQQAIEKAIPVYFQPGSVVSQAAEYSLLNGGKRVRGVLTLATCSLLQGDGKISAEYSAAIEMVHAFSLIHDDLPCMDNDNMRRGKPACHIAFGEANALLAGDLLSIAAFATIAGAGGGAERNNAAAVVLAAASGAKGMIYGQELDMQAEETPVDAEGLAKIHRHKTGALITGAVHLGIVAAGQATEAHSALTLYAQNIGSVFQIVDDILDVVSNPELLGKPIGSDSKNGKTTYITLYGMEQAKAMARKRTQQAVEEIQKQYGEKAGFLCWFAQTLLERIY